MDAGIWLRRSVRGRWLRVRWSFCGQSLRCAAERRHFRSGYYVARRGLVGLPLVGVGLGQADVGEDSVDEVAGHVFGGLRVVVESGDGGEDGGAGVGGELHVAQVDAVEGGFADAEDQGTVFFEADVGGAVDEVVGEAVGDAGQGAHGAGEDDHGGGGVAAAGDVGSDVGFGMLLDLGAGRCRGVFRRGRCGR